MMVNMATTSMLATSIDILGARPCSSWPTSSTEPSLYVDTRSSGDEIGPFANDAYSASQIKAYLSDPEVSVVCIQS